MIKVGNLLNLEKEMDGLNKGLNKLKSKIAHREDRRVGSSFSRYEEEANEAIELEKTLVMEKHIADIHEEVNHALEKY